jgi:hypothetical protein
LRGDDDSSDEIAVNTDIDSASFRKNADSHDKLARRIEHGRAYGRIAAVSSILDCRNSA